MLHALVFWMFYETPTKFLDSFLWVAGCIYLAFSNKKNELPIANLFAFFRKLLEIVQPVLL